MQWQDFNLLKILLENSGYIGSFGYIRLHTFFKLILTGIF